MDNIEDRFAKMWRKAREDAGKSQEYVAKALGVSRKTIQNWEAGYSCPSQIMGFRFFSVLDVQPLPYYLELLYGEFDSLTAKSSDEAIEKALIQFIKSLTPDLKRKMLFMVDGVNGSSALGLIELFTAYSHLPLSYRIALAQSILIDYEIAESEEAISDHVRPNIELLSKSIIYGKKAVHEKKHTYSNLKEVTEG